MMAVPVALAHSERAHGVHVEAEVLALIAGRCSSHALVESTRNRARLRMMSSRPVFGAVQVGRQH
jgi:hypothetical protein